MRTRINIAVKMNDGETTNIYESIINTDLFGLGDSLNLGNWGKKKSTVMLLTYMTKGKR